MFFSICRALTPLAILIFLVAWATFAVCGILIFIRLQELQEETEMQRILSQARLQVVWKGVYGARAFPKKNTAVIATLWNHLHHTASRCITLHLTLHHREHRGLFSKKSYAELSTPCTQSSSCSTVCRAPVMEGPCCRCLHKFRQVCVAVF